MTSAASSAQLFDQGVQGNPTRQEFKHGYYVNMHSITLSADMGAALCRKLFLQVPSSCVALAYAQPTPKFFLLHKCSRALHNVPGKRAINKF